mmetsp:Transcript_27571/g.35719  ORF Transcript_27571/g.35719 Transcript_27571/m.35719 type:complete len:527 (+) Transcript_27571:118-1698(+)
MPRRSPRFPRRSSRCANPRDFFIAEPARLSGPRSRASKEVVIISKSSTQKKKKTLKNVLKPVSIPCPPAPKVVISRPIVKSSSGPPPHIAARTDIDLSKYKYGEEPTEIRNEKLDLVFCLDCTASMGSVIAACKKDISTLVKTLDSSSIDVRFCLIPYRDHSMNEQYCTKVYPFTRDESQMQSNIDDQAAGGGGDAPEAVTAAMFEALCLDWRNDAAKQVVFMADAGPHGLGDGHSFKDGDPDGKDPLSIANEMLSLGIVVNSIFTRTQDSNAKYFFACLSDRTGGQCMGMDKASELHDLVVTGAKDIVMNERAIVGLRGALEALSTEKGRELTPEEEAAETSRVLSSSPSSSSSTSSSMTIDDDGEKPTKKAKTMKKSSCSSSVPSSLRDGLIVAPPEKLEAFKKAKDILDLQNLWRALSSSSSSSSSGFGTGGAVAAAPRTAAARVISMKKSRDVRSTDKVTIECVADGKSKVRARVVAGQGYDSNKNVQFPRNIRVVGKRFLVDVVVNAGSFYRVKGAIVEEE